MTVSGVTLHHHKQSGKQHDDTVLTVLHEVVYTAR